MVSQRDVEFLTERAAYDVLCAYTLTHGDAAFIHQHVVDAFAAQTATASSKPIMLAMSLVGLYLTAEKGYSGRQVQHIHSLLARGGRKTWPFFTLPDDRGAIRVGDVMAAAPGPERDREVHRWCAAVWAAFVGNRATVVELLRTGLP